MYLGCRAVLFVINVRSRNELQWFCGLRFKVYSFILAFRIESKWSMLHGCVCSKTWFRTFFFTRLANASSNCNTNSLENQNLCTKNQQTTSPMDVYTIPSFLPGLSFQFMLAILHRSRRAALPLLCTIVATKK